MSEAEIVTTFATLSQSFVNGLQASFTIVSAYLVALYFFLGRAPIILKITAFAFFTAVLAVLAIYMAGAMSFGDGVAVALMNLRSAGKLSHVGQVTLALANHDVAFLVEYASVAIGVAVYASLFYLTFFYPWRPIGET